MAVPEGYTALARIGYADKGNYAAGTTYMTGDVVYHNGSSYVARKDNLKGVTPTNGNDWKYLARGFAAETMTDVQATDTNGVLGTAGAQVVSQALIDAIADRVMTKLVERSSIVQTESTSTTTAPSSAYFKQVTDRVISDLGQHVDGKFILPNGLKICWGNATGSGLRSISFPITYTSPPYISVGTLVASEEYSYSTVIVSRSLTGFTFREHWHRLNNNTDGVGQDPCIYFAIGY